MIDQIKQTLIQRKQKSFERKYKKAQGLTLIEVGLAVGVAALVIGAALYFYKTALTKSQAYSLTNLTQAATSACASDLGDGKVDCSQTLQDTGIITDGRITEVAYKAGQGNTPGTITAKYLQGAISGDACKLMGNNLGKLNIKVDATCTSASTPY